MALDVYVAALGDKPYGHSLKDEYICGFESEEGYYWFLHPLFEELAETTGKYIDLYDFVAFGETALEDLEKTILSAQKLVSSKPDRWQVQTAIQPEIWSEVTKAQFESILSRLAEAIRSAKLQNLSVVFYGD